jgi:purine-cytosine permease-like protein
VATTTDLDAHVPVREGDYGSKVGAVEPGGIEYIPDRERHGNPIQLFWTWVSPNMEFATVFVGVLPIAVFGGGFWPTVFGVTLGSLMGSITHALVSTMGPRYGVPQMVEGRASFGFFGNFLPAALSWLTASFGWFIVNSVSGTFALVTLTSVLNKNAVLSFPIAFVIVVVVQVVVAFIGHNMIHQFERIIFPYLTIVFGLATIVILAQARIPEVSRSRRASASSSRAPCWRSPVRLRRPFRSWATIRRSSSPIRCRSGFRSWSCSASRSERWPRTF